MHRRHAHFSVHPCRGGGAPGHPLRQHCAAQAPPATPLAPVNTHNLPLQVVQGGQTMEEGGDASIPNDLQSQVGVYISYGPSHSISP